MNTATNSYIALFLLSSDNFVFLEGIPIKQVTHITRGFSHRDSQAFTFLFNNSSSVESRKMKNIVGVGGGGGGGGNAQSKQS